MTTSATGILPEWLALLWAVVFLAIVAAHCHHLLTTHGQRRAWHCTHVAMALGMAAMYASSGDLLSISGWSWRAMYAGAVAVVLIWMLKQTLTHRMINGLWLLAAIDLAAMVYMWDAGGLVGPVTWLVVVYFAAQAALWATNGHRQVDERLRIGGVSAATVGPDGTIAFAAPISARPLMGSLQLRASMIAMTLGMAYMLAAMQLMG